VTLWRKRFIAFLKEGARKKGEERIEEESPHFSTSGVTAISIAAGGYTTCIIANGGGVKCWGWNGYGQLGIGSSIQQLSPKDVIGATRTSVEMEC
jgi:alpha-tubulin suppressor-like RCC1 family protein